MARGESLIYAIQVGANGPVKIGTTIDVAVRLTDLQIANPETLHLRASFPGGRDKEQEIHTELAAFRIRGEWFRPAPEVAAVLRREKVKDEREHRVGNPAQEQRVHDVFKCDVCTGPLDTDEYGEHVHLRGICGACEEFQDLRESGEDPFAYLDQEAA